jgi:DNA-binding HxlR family transcriptional regulator
MKEAVPTICERFHQAVELIGSRWTGAVIQALLRGPTRYASIRAAIPDISDRMLSDRLRVLEMEGLVERHVVPETPVRVEYQLTEKGRCLERAMGAIGEWAERWIDLPDSPAPMKGVPLPPSSAGRSAESHPVLHKPRIKPRVAP